MFPLPFSLVTDLPAALVAGLVIQLLWPERGQRMQSSYSKDLAINFFLGVCALIGGTAAIVALALTILGIPLSVLLAAALTTAFYVGSALASMELGRAVGVRGAKDDPVIALLVGTCVVFVVGLVPGVGDLARLGLSLVGLGCVINTKLGTTEGRFELGTTKTTQLEPC